MRSMAGTKQRLRCLAVSSTCRLGLTPSSSQERDIEEQHHNEDTCARSKIAAPIFDDELWHALGVFPNRHSGGVSVDPFLYLGLRHVFKHGLLDGGRSVGLTSDDEPESRRKQRDHRRYQDGPKRDFAPAHPVSPNSGAQGRAASSRVPWSDGLCVAFLYVVITRLVQSATFFP